ncbi:ATP-dependent DNA helicase DDX31 [Prorops nasuta]|uniref:ATP-dependent DNA helicase DDX31 n=1 Tax=Prorops nasuta TaxID=863751 RepID=UPI0034CF609D
MKLQDMDISLNITTEPAAEGAKKKYNKNTKHRIKKMGKPIISKNSKLDSKSTEKRRIKQKSLATIFANKIKNIGKDEGVLKIGQDIQKNVQEKNASNEISSSNNTNTDTPILTFSKVPKKSIGKPLLVKKRDDKSSGLKRSLNELFSSHSESFSKVNESNLLDIKLNVDKQEEPETKKNNDFNGQDRNVKKNIDKKNREANVKPPKQLNVKNKKYQKMVSFVEERESKAPNNFNKGKISSLFGNNPEIPNIGQRLVKPVNEAVFTEKTFSDFGIHPYTVSNLKQNMNITKMTTVQQKAIPEIFRGKDVLIRSQTGSGKTLAYALPIVEFLHKIRPKLTRNSGLKALVIVPTRELALQTYETFLKLIKPFTWIVPGYLTGGEKRKAEKARLRKGCTILVATPGRLLDHVTHTKALTLNDVKYFVLDEADRMLDMGYEKDISGIVNSLKAASNIDNDYNPMQMLRENVKKVFTDDDFKETEKEEQIIEKKRLVCNSDSEDDYEEEIKSEKLKPLINQQTSIKEADGPSIVKNETNNVGSIDDKERKTILLSATLSQSVEKLAGLTMKNPVFVDAAKENLEISGGDTSEINEDLVVPQSVQQSYIVTPPKLRMVTLSAYIAGKCQNAGEHKLIIFMATQDMIDYHMEILSSILTKPMDEDDEDSDPLVEVEFFQLHGSMTQKERTQIFKTFRQARSGVLLCTDVAARGLDMPKVDCVIQYTGPTSARDYVHRIGRTARAGSSGVSTIFLTPSEIDFVRMLESRRIRIKQENMEDVLDKLLGRFSKHRTPHAAAIALQNEFETLVVESKKLREKACKAYTSWIRFYSSYPHEMRQIFNRKELHLGHYAKSFALRESPQRIGGIGKKLREKETSGPRHNNRLSIQRSALPAQQMQRKRDSSGGPRSMGNLKKVRMLNVSEYDSGLEPIKKRRKT